MIAHDVYMIPPTWRPTGEVTLPELEDDGFGRLVLSAIGWSRLEGLERLQGLGAQTFCSFPLSHPRAGLMARIRRNEARGSIGNQHTFQYSQLSF